MALPVIAAVATAVAGVVSAVGAIQAGNAQAAAAERQAQIDERNALLAEQDRNRNIQLSRIEAEDLARKNRKRLSAARAAYGTAGIELTGTPLELLEASSIDMALDERRVEFQGQVQARQGATDIIGFRESADTSRAAGANAQTAGRINAISSIAKTGSSVAGGLQ